jgi:hypothetical protein
VIDAKLAEKKVRLRTDDSGAVIPFLEITTKLPFDDVSPLRCRSECSTPAR